MDWHQKADALNYLRPIAILTRGPGDWYVSQQVEIGGDGFLRREYGNGATPEAAVEDHWRKLVTDLPLDRFIVTSPTNERRQHWRWHGYMWRELPVPTGNREKLQDEIERLRTALRPFVEAYERCGRRESWAASYLNNNAWKAAAEALPTKDSQCHGEPGVDCPVHPMTEENQKPVNHIECRHCGAGCRFGGVLRHEPGCPALEKISG